MENYYIDRTIKTPHITANVSGEITIIGISIPEDVNMEFAPFLSWLNQYMLSPAEKTSFTVQLDYFNTSTASMLLGIFRSLTKIKAMGKKVEINWLHEPDDIEIMESGHDFASILDVDFNVVANHKN